MITRNRREPFIINSSTTALDSPVGHQPLSDMRISNSTHSWSSIVVMVLAFSLSPLPWATVFAQASTTDKPSNTKNQTVRKNKVPRARSKAKARKGAKRNARDSQEAKSEGGIRAGNGSRASGRANGKDRTGANESDRSESADNESLGNGRSTASENGTYGLNDVGAAEQGVKTFDNTPKGGATQRSDRMEFDARLVYGETAGSGAVILFERGQRQLPPLTKQRTEFLSATTEPIFGEKSRWRYRIRDESTEAKSNKSEDKSTIDGLSN